MIVLGISCFYHDASACLVQDGQIIAAAAEERFTRKKHDNGFPIHAINFCLSWIGIPIEKVDRVVFYEKPIVKFDRILRQHIATFPRGRKSFVESIGSWLDKKLKMRELIGKECGYHGEVLFTEHHMAHAASSFYLSPFDKAVIVTLDGVGEWTTTAVGVGNGTKIRLDKEIHFPHSLGLFYSTLTAYLGFAVNNDEYKVMGLAAYGDPKPFQSHMDHIIRTFEDGSYSLTMKYFDYTWADHMPSREMEKLFGIPARKPEAPMRREYENIAAAAQVKLEEVVFHLLCAAHKQYKIDNLALSGGVALNSVLNGKILTKTPFKHVFITPDPGDAGGAVGAALYGYYHDLPKRHVGLFYPYLGPSFTKEQIEDVLKLHNLTYVDYKDENKLLTTVATLLTKQKIIGWFQGRMEWGPRALGNRSILASAAKEEMKDIINAKVKHREMFRPFAPVILEKYVNEYFQADKNLSPSARYMLMVYPFKPKGRRDVPATVHVDGTGRLQVIRRSDNPRYYDLIEAYRKKTGVPIIVNTSFNVRGEPIVCTPYDAVQCFLGTEIDYLVMDTFLVAKKKTI